MSLILSFFAKNWKLTAALLAIISIVSFFQIQLWMSEAKYKDVVSQRDEAQMQRQAWHDSHVKLEAALSGVEADKKSLQAKLDQAKVAEAAAIKAANYNSAEAARVASLLRQIKESSNDPEYSDRVQSRAVDFLRMRQQEQADAASGN